LQEVIPQVQKAYKASGDRENRAIAGLSMGGAETLLTGLNHPDKFAWIGCFSAGGLGQNFAQEFPNAGPKMNLQLHLLWVSCGDRDNLLTSDRAFYDWITSRGVNAKWVELPGEHSFRVWRRNLADFAPLLFRDQK
jgi:enterochelin esterase family protein